MPTSMHMSNVTDTLKSACNRSGASYAIFWTEQGGRLAITGCYADDCAEFIAQSYAATVKPGQGIVGRVFTLKGEEMIYDVDGVDAREFTRKDLAKECGINTIACLFVDGGVLEYGSPKSSMTRLPKGFGC
mmetsp:Transcript_51819/g.136893  ORF Transcript_51819/g.136893 Transcript_51819/m.136893 type:complete len:131 (-) Transcript_51819:79-471(-)